MLIIRDAKQLGKSQLLSGPTMWFRSTVKRRFTKHDHAVIPPALLFHLPAFSVSLGGIRYRLNTIL
jgi:hypothetical protein